ncbi:hypothetical protein B0A49_08856 [Cryomyces minteri]|uniref:Uncharacterized protein n=1 Tax=Cryomyces minteri TaxID=331657 RepID=A0A4U0WBI4_9PEZI|nr:hypothetical protein B0A49_08856 [Cryomyces minteri]
MPDIPLVVEELFPAQTRTASAEINGIITQVMSVSFADKIMVTISQGGRLAHWVHVPLDTSGPNPSNLQPYGDEDEPDATLLPMAHLTATTVLGGTIPERNTIGQLYATQIASALSTKNPEERRMVVVGLGLEMVDLDRESFMDMIELVLQCL